MKGIKLDKKVEKYGSEGSAKCYLTQIELSEYVICLPDNYRDFEVQREIVKNTYLDNLIETVLNRRHIPPIVLIADSYTFDDSGKNLEIGKFKILDGLQRTFRLKLIWDTIELFNLEIEKSKEILTLKRIQLSRRYASELRSINSSSKILEEIIKFYNKKKREEGYDIATRFDTNQWFEIWIGLTPKQEVSKMLILNAGHKPVKTKHQLELLFRSLIPVVKSVGLENFELIREKKMSSTSYSKGRKVGQFHFAHIITSILSLSEGKPLTTNVSLVHKTQAEDFNFDKFDKYFSYNFLHEFIKLLLELDEGLEKEYGDDGVKWLGREIALVGIFAALGKVSKENNLSARRGLELLREKIVSSPEILNLEDFEYQRNRLNLRKVNIGSVNKKAVYEGTYDILSGDIVDVEWSHYFKGVVL